MYLWRSWKGFPCGSEVKNLPTMQETLVWFLAWEDPLEMEIATQSSILAWKIPWTEESGGVQSMGSPRVRHDWATNTLLEKAKEKGFGILGVEYCGKVTIWGKLTAEKDYFGRACLCRPISMLIFCLQWYHLSLPGLGDWTEAAFHREKFIPCFLAERGRAENSSMPLFLNCLQLSITQW